MKFLKPEQEQMTDETSDEWGKRPNSGWQGADSEGNIRVPDCLRYKKSEKITGYQIDEFLAFMTSEGYQM